MCMAVNLDAYIFFYTLLLAELLLSIGIQISCGVLTFPKELVIFFSFFNLFRLAVVHTHEQTELVALQKHGSGIDATQ